MRPQVRTTDTYVAVTDTAVRNRVRNMATSEGLGMHSSGRFRKPVAARDPTSLRGIGAAVVHQSVNPAPPRGRLERRERNVAVADSAAAAESALAHVESLLGAFTDWSNNSRS
jgi:hypothetical protein